LFDVGDDLAQRVGDLCLDLGDGGFAAALSGIAGLPAMRPPEGASRPGPRAVAEGIGFIRRSQVIVGAFLTDLNATVFGLPVALFPAINAERFGGDPRTLGLFTTAIGVGGLAGAAFSGPVRRVSRQGRAMLAAVTVWGRGLRRVRGRPWPVADTQPAGRRRGR